MCCACLTGLKSSVPLSREKRCDGIAAWPDGGWEQGNLRTWSVSLVMQARQTFWGQRSPGSLLVGVRLFVDGIHTVQWRGIQAYANSKDCEWQVSWLHVSKLVGDRKFMISIIVHDSR